MLLVRCYPTLRQNGIYERTCSIKICKRSKRRRREKRLRRRRSDVGHCNLLAKIKPNHNQLNQRFEDMNIAIFVSHIITYCKIRIPICNLRSDFLGLLHDIVKNKMPRNHNLLPKRINRIQQSSIPCQQSAATITIIVHDVYDPNDKYLLRRGLAVPTCSSSFSLLRINL